MIVSILIIISVMITNVSFSTLTKLAFISMVTRFSTNIIASLFLFKILSQTMLALIFIVVVIKFLSGLTMPEVFQVFLALG